METLTFLGGILVIHFLALASPGPDFVMVVKNALGYGRSTGIRTAIGIGLGIGVHVLYCTFGLALIISKSIVAFSIIKRAGAAYLVYIGIKSLRARWSSMTIKTHEYKRSISRYKALVIWFFTNVLNPKATMFFLGLFTLVITPNTSQTLIVLAGISMILLTMVWFSFVTLCLTQTHIQRMYYKAENIINKLFGWILIVFGIKVALSKME